MRSWVVSATAVLLSASPALAGISLSVRLPPFKAALAVTATDTAVKDLSALNLEGAVETYLSDGVVVGGTYDYNAAVATPEEIYIKKSFDARVGNLGLDLRYNLPEQVASLTTVLKRKADFIRAAFNTRRILERVDISKTFLLPGDRRLSITPSYSNKLKSFNLEVLQDIQAGTTNAILELSEPERDLKLTVNHRVDDNNVFSPKLSVKKGYLTYGWTHLLGSGAKLEATLDPFEDLDVVWSDPGQGGEWVTRANIPLKNPQAATLAFKRKFIIN